LNYEYLCPPTSPHPPKGVGERAAEQKSIHSGSPERRPIICLSSRDVHPLEHGAAILATGWLMPAPAHRQARLTMDGQDLSESVIVASFCQERRELLFRNAVDVNNASLVEIGG